MLASRTLVCLGSVSIGIPILSMNFQDQVHFPDISRNIKIAFSSMKTVAILLA